MNPSAILLLKTLNPNLALPPRRPLIHRCPSPSFRCPVSTRGPLLLRCTSCDAFLKPQGGPGDDFDLLRILKGANSVIPHVALATTILALLYPPSFTWFTTRYYAPALGFLMFAVGVNSSAQDFVEAFKRPDAIDSGYAGSSSLRLGWVTYLELLQLKFLTSLLLLSHALVEHNFQAMQLF